MIVGRLVMKNVSQWNSRDGELSNVGYANDSVF